ncbi:unnamed protein product [Didymodactylos carnosus]|uniref:STAS domain-containing protein n=1 Tax=Didymodactylos carnosus TaxID=1234261 RepID=A0A814GI17_9BILA|nr:unnamed protein product [Didymodactylos carnosus]CAF0996683.1 unnamed protein product [Didymodactylos carnosus]CAF3538552.1 unnamed protein product [Didymodactylos carnosus]CAF3768345.1 unnamed protein product [Didymodactylos carnosus]
MEIQDYLYVDDEPVPYQTQIKSYFQKLPASSKKYVRTLFPIFGWLPRYNLTWLIGDLIAGITVGVIIVPQGMGYAKVANLDPQYGLYSSFVGLCMYCFFATSKDISIGPTAVMSLLIGQTISSVGTTLFTGPQIASTLALFGGIISLAIGLFRLGVIVDFIPDPAIAGFMTGSCITIIIGQLPKLFGITGISSSLAAYLILGYTLQGLPGTHVDLAFGAIGLIWLYGIRYLTQFLTSRYPRFERPLFFFGIARNAILVIFGTLIAYGINVGQKTSPISILKTVPSGFREMHVPNTSISLLSTIAGTIPPVVVILILEHVAIAKSFGRINDYKINPNQELVAIGVTNIIGSFFSAYPTTGSFSRTAIKAKSGVRTPLAGVFSSLVVLLALYALTPAFYYIPDAILAAVIIHSVGDLASGPRVWKHLLDVHPLELFIFVAAVIITFFTTVEYGIYTSIGVSLIVILYRIARPSFSILGRITNSRGIYFPIDHPSVKDHITVNPNGIVIIRLNESLTYPNSSYITEKMIDYLKANTRRGKPLSNNKGDRAWNDSTPLEMSDTDKQKPVLKAFVIDFAGVANMDSTGIQCISDVRAIANRWANRYVFWHFVNVNTPEARRILIKLGFGSQSITIASGLLPSDRTKDLTAVSVVPMGQSNNQETKSSTLVTVKDKYTYFHYDIDEAVETAQKSYSP